MSDTDKLVAAILAAAKVSAMAGEHAADLYIGEYVAIREALRKMETEETLKEVGSDDLPVIEALKKAQKLGDGK
jgi:hypothetical protein